MMSRGTVLLKVIGLTMVMRKRVVAVCGGVAVSRAVYSIIVVPRVVGVPVSSQLLSVKVMSSGKDGTGLGAGVLLLRL